MIVQVVEIKSDKLIFNNGAYLTHTHDQDCCESHYLSFDDLSLTDFKGLQFDISGDTFFKRIKDYGIELIPVKGWGVKIPGYGSNNGYYSSELTLELRGDNLDKIFDITECQEVDWS